jgi:hypothetical protein
VEWERAVRLLCMIYDCGVWFLSGVGVNGSVLFEFT